MKYDTKIFSTDRHYLSYLLELSPRTVSEWDNDIPIIWKILLFLSTKLYIFVYFATMCLSNLCSPAQLLPNFQVSSRSLITWFENELHIPFHALPGLEKKLLSFKRRSSTNHFPPDFLVNLQFVFIGGEKHGCTSYLLKKPRAA